MLVPTWPAAFGHSRNGANDRPSGWLGENDDPTPDSENECPVAAYEHIDHTVIISPCGPPCAAGVFFRPKASAVAGPMDGGIVPSGLVSGSGKFLKPAIVGEVAVMIVGSGAEDEFIGDRCRVARVADAPSSRRGIVPAIAQRDIANGERRAGNDAVVSASSARTGQTIPPIFWSA